MTSYDAVVIGSGPNGLVAANHLADAGWSVLVLEGQPDLGGAVRSANDVHPDFVHDTFSAFYPLAAASPTIRSFGLEDHGLTWTHAPTVLGHPLPDGQWALLDRDRQVTAAWFEEQQPGDGEAWLDLCSDWDVIGEHLIRGLLTPFPPVRATLGGLLRLPRVGGLQFVRTLLTPALDLGRNRFKGEAPRVLLAGNAGHSDIPLDAPGSGLMALMMSMMGQTVGFPVPEGGAGELTQALARRLRSLGGEIRCSSPVERISTSHGRARTVHTADGHSVEARRAVVATVVAPRLYDDLLDPADVPDRVRRGMKAFQLDPGTVKVDWALSGPVPVAERAGQGTRHRAHRRRRHRHGRGARSGRRRPGPRPAVHARRPDDHHGRDPVPGRHRVDVGLHPRAAGHRRGRRRGGDPRSLGPRRPRAVRRPDAGPVREDWRPGSARSSSNAGSSARSSSRAATPT